jgi:hypothetical protein
MIILLGNYAPDRQESMQRFAALLQEELRRYGTAVTLVRPRPVCGGFGDPTRGLAKRLG